MSKAAFCPLLSEADPAPVELVHADSTSPIFLLCEHAGQAVPSALGDLGVDQGVLDSHRGWDIGAAALARGLAARLGAPLVLQRYSRLVIDCNRPPEGDFAIPLESDAVEIPGNHALSDRDRAMRIASVFAPMDAAISDLITRDRKAAFSIHSFTPEMNGLKRPWQAGFLSRADLATARKLRDHVAATHPDMTLAINDPYQIEADSDWFIPAHAERLNLIHSLIEVRNDQLLTPESVEIWTDCLAEAILSVL